MIEANCFRNCPILGQYKPGWFLPNLLPERPSGAQCLELAVGKQAAVEHPGFLSPSYWEISFQVQWRRVHDYAESRQFFASGVVNMLNITWVTSQISINKLQNCKEYQLFCFSSLYFSDLQRQNHTVLSEYLCKAWMFHFFAPPCSTVFFIWREIMSNFLTTGKC